MDVGDSHGSRKLIVVTWPERIPEEMQHIHQLFEEGLACLQVRKPGMPFDELMNWIGQVDSAYRDRLVLPYDGYLRYTPQLDFCRNVHFSETLRRSVAPSERLKLSRQGFVLSTSVHDAAGYLALDSEYSYALLGPLFDSISKSGYKAMPEGVREVCGQKTGVKLMAIGGIGKANCATALEYGFDGVAVCGSIWKSDQPVSTFKYIRTCITKDL